MTVYHITFRPRVSHVFLYGHKVITEATPRHVGGSISVTGVESTDDCVRETEREREREREERTEQGIARRTSRRKRDELFIEFQVRKLSRRRTGVHGYISTRNSWPYVRTYNFLRRLINLACNRDQFLWCDIAARKTRAKAWILTPINDERNNDSENNS